MRGNWCKNCNEFVEIKKDYTSTKVCVIIYLIAIGIGFLVSFPYGGLTVVFYLPAILIIFTYGYILGLLTGRRACIICRKTTRRKRIRK